MRQPAFCQRCRARICARCGDLIPDGRVKTLPNTVVCARCSETLGGEEQRGVILEHGGKAQSLKKNYTGIKVTRRQRDVAKHLPDDPPEHCPRCRDNPSS